MAQITANGVTFGDQYGISATTPTQTSGWFHYKFTVTGGFSFGGSAVVGQTTDTMNLPARSKVFVYTYTPLRGDTNSWGGHYEDLQYEVNSGSWTSVGRSGFVSRMQNNAYNITKHTDFCVFDFGSITSDFALRLRTTHREYNSGGSVITSCAVGSGDAGANNNGQYTFYKQIIVQGFAQE